ncbi:MAG: malonyl-CoA synthase [Stappiaceae bacterium]
MGNYLFDGLLEKVDPAARFAKSSDGRLFTYQDVLDRSAQFANALADLGIKPGDRVAAQIPKSIDALMLYLGTVRAGGIFLALNTAYTASEVDYFLENSEPGIFVCAPDDRQNYKDLADQRGITLETLGIWKSDGTGTGSLAFAADSAKTSFLNIDRNADDLAAILYTSGTTGRSKGAMLSHDNLFSNAKTLSHFWHFSKDDVLLHALPVFHTHGLFVATNIVLFTGASMIFHPSFNADDVIDALSRATSMMGVPTFYTRLLDNPRFDKTRVDHMRLFISGSAPLLAETHVDFERRTGHRILERYGMTETNMNTSNPYLGERRAGTVGIPLPGTALRIADPETGIPLPDGEIGIIEVSGRNVFKGYWQMPEKTKEEFRDDGYFITGDLAKIDDEGYVHIVGRSKDLIISGGYNIYPKEVELLLDEQDGVRESAVIGVPHPDFGEGVIGILVQNGEQPIDAENILASISDKIARFKQPKRLYVVDELPRNTMGKVQKNVLREQYGDAFSG